jgi:hypothetical protein
VPRPRAGHLRAFRTRVSRAERNRARSRETARGGDARPRRERRADRARRLGRARRARVARVGFGRDGDRRRRRRRREGVGCVLYTGPHTTASAR